MAPSREKVNRIVRGLHEEIERQRDIVRLCDFILQFRVVSFVHGLARRERARAEGDIVALRSTLAAMRLVTDTLPRDAA